MTIVVVGDVMLDVDLAGEATRLSPDAPVPVVDVTSVRRRAGGAGLVARMLAADGRPVTLVTVLSADDAGRQLAAELAGVQLVAGATSHPSPVKTRVRAGSHPVVRFDQGCAATPVPHATPDMLRAVEAAEVVIVADYGRGLAANPQLRIVLEQVAKKVPVIWDPHPAGADPVPGVAVVTPNLAEARKAAATAPAGQPAGTGHGDNPGGIHARASAETASIEVAGESAIAGEAARLAHALLARWRSGAVLVTTGADGAVLLQEGNAVSRCVPAPRVETGDPCGAGDRLAAGLAVHLLSGLGLEEAATLAVRDAADFLAAGGVSALAGAGEGIATPALPAGPAPAAAAVSAAVSQQAGFPAGPALAPPSRTPARRRSTEPLLLARTVRGSGGTVVATGGCFDLLHAGHVRSLAAARELGDCLVVCLNSDASTQRLKGPGRPIISQQDRAELLLAMECVDAVLVFDEDNPEAALQRLRPDIWVKGGDYRGARLPEADLVESWGGRCLTVPFHPARSTTGLADALAKVG